MTSEVVEIGRMGFVIFYTIYFICNCFIQALQLGGKFYVQALRLHNSSLLWHDLGLNYFYQAQEGGAENKNLAVSAVQVGIYGTKMLFLSFVAWYSFDFCI